MKEKIKHLDGRGQGQFLYDFKYDILTFKIKNRDYKMSVEFQNFIIDIDEEGFVTGIRVQDASNVFGVDKYFLKNIAHGEFKSSIESNVINVRIDFVSIIRNKLVPIFSKKENVTQQITTPLGPNQHFDDSLVECPITN